MSNISGDENHLWGIDYGMGLAATLGDYSGTDVSQSDSFA
jgi:hypothetical protein